MVKSLVITVFKIVFYHKRKKYFLNGGAMLVKVDGRILKFPLTESLQFQNFKELNTKINKFDSHLQDYWMTPTKGESSLNHRYEYEAVCRIISESSDEQIVNKYIHGYFSKVKNDSVVVIKQFIIGMLGRKGAITLFEETFLVLYNALLELYESELEEIFEKRYLEKWAIKLFIEQSMFLLTLLVKAKYYFSIEELSFRYNYLFFPYFFDGSYFSKNRSNEVNSKFLSNTISKLKQEERFKTDILEFKENGRKYNYISFEMVNYIERTSTKIKKIFDYTFYAQTRKEIFDTTNSLINKIYEDYIHYLDLQALDQEKFKEALENFGNEKSVLINKVSIVYLIIQDILSYTNIDLDFEKYEESFWYQYQKEIVLLYNNRSEFKELYLSSLFFILLYANRIRLGKMDFKLFKYLFNTNPEYKSLVEKVRPIFEGTKQSTIFSKVFEKFISQQLFPDFERRLKSKEEWKKAKQIIEKNIDPNSRQEVVAENLKKTDREINNFLQFLNTKFKLIVDEANKSIAALNKKQIEISSWITEPLTEDELAKNNYIRFSSVKNSTGERELRMVKDGKYSKISMADFFLLL